GLFSVDNPDGVGKARIEVVANISQEKETLMELHEKLANFECKSCVLLKITKQPFKERLETVSKPFERLHLDLFGPINPESSLKNQFILTVVDNYSGYLAGFPITQKDETTDVLINLIKTEHSRQEAHPKTSIGTLSPRTQWWAEQANRTILESMRATFNSSGIQKQFWHEVLKSCCLGLKIKSHGKDVPTLLGIAPRHQEPSNHRCVFKTRKGSFLPCQRSYPGRTNNSEKEFEKRFSNSSCHSPNTILGMKFEQEEGKIKLSLPNHIQHGSAIGLLNHITQLTCPDISYVVSSLARFSVKPGMTHWHKVKKVWQYLQGTKDIKLNLQIKNPNQLLQIFTEVHNLFFNQSGTESLVESYHEGVWLKVLLAEMWNIQMMAVDHLIDNPELLERLMMTEEQFEEKYVNEHLIDNKGLDDKVKQFGSNPKTQHIDLKKKGLRQEVKHQNLRITLIGNKEMVAKALTKAASKPAILNLFQHIDPNFFAS
ncbi:hypothetical protein VP01_2216g1, partial [Puccinia sorghi]